MRELRLFAIINDKLAIPRVLRRCMASEKSDKLCAIRAVLAAFGAWRSDCMGQGRMTEVGGNYVPISRI